MRNADYAQYLRHKAKDFKKTKKALRFQKHERQGYSIGIALTRSNKIARGYCLNNLTQRTNKNLELCVHGTFDTLAKNGGSIAGVARIAIKPHPEHPEFKKTVYVLNPHRKYRLAELRSKYNK